MIQNKSNLIQVINNRIINIILVKSFRQKYFLSQGNSQFDWLFIYLYKKVIDFNGVKIVMKKS